VMWEGGCDWSGYCPNLMERLILLPSGEANMLCRSVVSPPRSRSEAGLTDCVIMPNCTLEETTGPIKGIAFRFDLDMNIDSRMCTTS
jgi:hypothetical protein